MYLFFFKFFSPKCIFLISQHHTPECGALGSPLTAAPGRRQDPERGHARERPGPSQGSNSKLLGVPVCAGRLRSCFLEISVQWVWRVVYLSVLSSGSRLPWTSGGRCPRQALSLSRSPCPTLAPAGDRPLTPSFAKACYALEWRFWIDSLPSKPPPHCFLPG